MQPTESQVRLAIVFATFAGAGAPADAITGNWLVGTAEVLVTEYADGSVVGTWVADGQPAFSGTREGSQLTLVLPNGTTATATLSSDGMQIVLASGEVWTKGMACMADVLPVLPLVWFVLPTFVSDVVSDKQ